MDNKMDKITNSIFLKGDPSGTLSNRNKWEIAKIEVSSEDLYGN